MTVAASANLDWTPFQRQAIAAFDQFLGSSDLRAALILRGAAGTGKTTLARELVSMAKGRGRMCRLVAPTGRAARVLKDRTGYDTSTIHSCIYSLQEIVEQVDESEHLKQKIEQEPIPDALPPPHPDKSVD